MKKLLQAVTACLLFLSGCGTYTSGENTETPVPTETAEITEMPEESTAPPAPTVTPVNEGQYSETMLDVGQGLSILIEADGEYMLYDGGGRESSSYVVSYLKNLGIDHLKYMFISHYDEDHCAGCIGVLKTCDVDTVVCGDYVSDTQIYASLMKAMAGVNTVHPSVGDTFALGNSVITVLSPPSYDSADENDSSIVIRIVYGSFASVITGDAEAVSEERMVYSGMDLKADVLVAGHHGSASSSSDAFVNAVSPSYVFISCKKGNVYGHPSAEALEVFRSRGCSLYRTDDQGEVTVYADGSTYWFSEDPCNDFTPGVKSSDEETVTVSPENGYQYVLNTHTKKFHYPTCPSVSQMKEENTAYSNETRDQLIAEGYSPCGNCKP